ncbi:hypothetical protein [Shimia sp.]|uniref:hypothetical protein n=1 Tax=Shimia sp. TaxID=1954381 RepID=UPI003B8B17A3
MQDLKNVYRRYALAFATFSIAICIGFVMQTSEAAVLVVEEHQSGARTYDDTYLPKDLNVPQLGSIVALPNMPKERGIAATFPNAPVLVAVSDDLPVGLVPSEERVPRLGCAADVSAKTTAGALVVLHISAPCQSQSVVQVSHEGLSFRKVLSDKGLAEIVMPALAEEAAFTVTFSDGAQVRARARVDSLPFYDRVVLQWHGVDGPELHAREFGAGYGDAGHVWREAPRAVAALAGGSGGFLMRLNGAAQGDRTNAEIYTFPSGIAKASGDIAISIEAEVTASNCNQEISLSSLALRQGVLGDLHELTMQMPDCSAVGEYLLLKNLVEDLTIAQN